MNTINTPNSQVYNNIPKERSILSLINSYLELNFDVLHAAASNRYVDGDDISLVNLCPIALFSNYKLRTSSGKQLENFYHAHIVCLMYKLITSARGSDDLSIGFDRDRGRGQHELTNNKNIKGKYHVRIYLRDVFGFPQQQERRSFALGYKLTLTRNTDYAVLNKGNAINNGKIKINAIEWYVPCYTPSITQKNISMNQIIKKMASKPRYKQRSVFMKEVNTQIFWTFELGTQEGINIPIWICVFFQQNDRQHYQKRNNGTFCRLPVTSAQSFIGTERYPDSAILLNHDDDDYSQGYGQIQASFKPLDKRWYTTTFHKRRWL